MYCINLLPLAHLLVEVEETFRAVLIVEHGKRVDRTVNVHRVSEQPSLSAHDHPMRVGATHKHLSNAHEQEKQACSNNNACDTISSSD